MISHNRFDQLQAYRAQHGHLLHHIRNARKNSEAYTMKLTADRIATLDGRSTDSGCPLSCLS